MHLKLFQMSEIRMSALLQIQRSFKNCIFPVQITSHTLSFLKTWIQIKHSQWNDWAFLPFDTCFVADTILSFYWAFDTPSGSMVMQNAAPSNISITNTPRIILPFTHAHHSLNVLKICNFGVSSVKKWSSHINWYSGLQM